MNYMYNASASRALAELIDIVMNNPSSKDDYIKIALYLSDIERIGSEEALVIASTLIK